MKCSRDDSRCEKLVYYRMRELSYLSCSCKSGKEVIFRCIAP